MPLIDGTSHFLRHFVVHFTQVPKLDGLVLAVTNNVVAVHFGVYECNALHVTGENSDWSVVERTSVPDLDERVVTTTAQCLRTLIQEAHGVDVVVVSIDTCGSYASVQVVEIQRRVAASTDNLTTVRAEL